MKNRLYLGLLLGMVVCAYANSVRDGFTLDDLQLYIVHNAQVTEPSLKKLFTPHASMKVFRPVTFGTFALDWKTGGGRPWIFHAVNLALHAAVVALLYLLLKAVLQELPDAQAVAFAAAMLFAAHPIHTEAVTSIVGRAELLAAGFLLAAWILHLMDREVFALLCFALALLSKESAVIFLPLAILGDYVRGQWKATRRYLELAGVTLVYLGLLWKIEGGHLGRADVPLLDNPLAALSPGWRILNALGVAWKYVALQIYPAKLSCDYSFNAIPVDSDWRHALPAGIAALAVVAGWIWAMWKRHCGIALAGGIYLIGFTVTANILMPIGTIMGERLAYLPSAGLCLLIALAWNWLRNRQRQIAVGVLVILVLVLGARTVLRNRDWKDNLTLFSADVQSVPGSAKIHEGLGAAYLEAGQFDLALQEMQKALQIYPDFPEAMESYGLLQSWKGNYQAAGPMMERAFYMVTRDNPHYDDMAVNLAALYVQTNHMDGALQLLNREISESPGYGRAWANRAVVHYKLGEVVAARADAETALRLEPGNKQARNLLQLLGTQPADLRR